MGKKTTTEKDKAENSHGIPQIPGSQPQQDQQPTAPETNSGNDKHPADVERTDDGAGENPEI